MAIAICKIMHAEIMQSHAEPHHFCKVNLTVASAFISEVLDPYQLLES